MITPHLFISTTTMQERRVEVIDKLIFLDIDGVLNNRDLDRGEYDESQYYSMHQSNLKALKRLLKATNATIVLSSAWRNSRESREQVAKFFKANGIPLYISITPHTGSRLGEILLWLKVNTTNVNLLEEEEEEGKVINNVHNNESLWKLDRRVKVNRWVILDDINFKKHDTDIEYYQRLPELGKHIVHTKRIYGLGNKDVEEAIEKLTTSIPCSYCELKSKWKDVTLDKIFCNEDCQLTYYHIHKLLK